ncbi:MAG: trypsin-like peptidase domain-containing protein [Pseudomonadota bacterium]
MGIRTSLVLVLLGAALQAAAVEYKAHPEYTGEIKDFTHSNQVLGISSDPDDSTSGIRSASMNFVKGLEKAVFHFRSFGCGATFVSSEGHAITALHCLEQLVRGSKPILKKEVIAVTDSGQEVTSNLANLDMEGESYNSWDLDPIRFPDAQDLLPIQVVALGRGYPDILKKWTPDSPEAIEYADLIKSYADDYAIVKLNKLPESYRCVNTAEQMPAAGSLTWAAGYPVNTRPHQVYLTEKTMDSLIFKSNFFAPDISVFLRKAKRRMRELTTESWYSFEGNQHNTPFFLAVGRAYETYSQMREEFSYPVFNRSDELLDMMTDREKYLVTTSYIKPGFSGGGVFNTDGELIGVNSMSPDVLTFMRDKFQPLISHVRVDHIKNELRAKLGAEALKEVFNCEIPHAVVK